MLLAEDRNYEIELNIRKFKNSGKEITEQLNRNDRGINELRYIKLDKY